MGSFITSAAFEPLQLLSAKVVPFALHSFFLHLSRIHVRAALHVTVDT
jgi:hypothetical protein